LKQKRDNLKSILNLYLYMYYAKKYYAKRSIQYRVPHSARRNHNY